MAISASRVTRLGMGGGVWQPHGSYDNKEEGVIPETPEVAIVPSGGNWWHDYDYEYQLRARKRKELIKLEVKADKISDKLDRALAKELRAQDREIERIQELRRLSALAQKHQKELQGHLNQRAIKAAEAAFESGTYSMMERMEREIARSREEEAFLIMATKIILDQ